MAEKLAILPPGMTWTPLVAPAAVMFPCHDHFIEEPMTGAGGTFALGIRVFNGYDHDWRCMGDCYHCGGDHTPYPCTPELRCLYCSDGSCTGCNAYTHPGD